MAITVKDLTKAMSIQDKKTRTEIASQSGGNRLEDMTGYGKDWPGTMKDQGFGDEPGTDPAEMIQLELPLESVKKLQIMAQENPEIAQGITDELMIAGGPYRMNKEGNAEVWEFGPKNYHYNPMPKSYYDLIKSVKGMNFKKADINESLQRENVGGTLRDMMLPLLIKEYGKDSGGSYKNPSKLLSGMKKLAQVYRGGPNSSSSPPYTHAKIK